MDPQAASPLRASSQTGNSKRKITEIDAQAVQIEGLPVKILASVAFHPLVFTSILKQLGFNPLKPVRVHTFKSFFGFGSRSYAYPFLGGYVKSQIGWVGLWTTGLPANLICIALQEYFCNENLTLAHMEQLVKSDKFDKDEFIQQLKNLILARIFADTVSHPFYVIMVHQMASIADKKPLSLSILQSSQLIWRDEGIMGFFAGLVPRVIGDILTILLLQLLEHEIAALLRRLGKLNESEIQPRTLRNKMCINMIPTAMLSILFFPFHTVSTVMCANDTRLSMGAKIRNWLDCWQELRLRGELWPGFPRTLTSRQLQQHGIASQ
jgi:carrier protein